MSKRGLEDKAKSGGERKKGYRIASRLLVALLIAASSNMLISMWVDTPKISKIKRDNLRLPPTYISKCFFPFGNIP